MKKLLIATLAAAMFFSLSACTDKTEGKEDGTGDPAAVTETGNTEKLRTAQMKCFPMLTLIRSLKKSPAKRRSMRAFPSFPTSSLPAIRTIILPWF